MEPSRKRSNAGLRTRKSDGFESRAFKRFGLKCYSKLSVCFCTVFLLSVFVSHASAASNSSTASVFGFSVVFGDSFTDYHRMYDRSGQPGPPNYSPGKNSNGKVWVENLSEKGVENLNMALQGSVTDQLVRRGYEWSRACEAERVERPGVRFDGRGMIRVYPGNCSQETPLIRTKLDAFSDFIDLFVLSRSVFSIKTDR
jgi:hypothetical protein